MKKRLILIVSFILVVAAIIFVPVPKTSYDDGGTREYQALTYKIVRWNRIIDADRIFSQTSVYWFPNNFKDIDTLWEDIDIKFAAQNEK